MKKKIAILGSTGSIGKTLIEIIKKDKKNFKIVLLSADENYKELLKQAKFFNVKNLIITNENSFNKVKKYRFSKKINIYNNFNNFRKIFKKKINYTMSAISGIQGLKPTIEMIKYSENIAIANKEAIICGWDLIKKQLVRNKTNFIPVDSEHFSIWSLLNNESINNVENIFITASGGPFLKYKLSKLKDVTPKEAIKHPNWNMGKKISVDSATLMNKVFEIIEAQRIFKVNLNKFEILIHPNSYLHAIVKFENGLTKMLVHDTSMTIPIFNTIYSENSRKLKNNSINLSYLNNLNLSKPDIKRFPILKIINLIPKNISLFETVIIAVNDELVNYFLKKKISFLDMQKYLLKILKFNQFKKYCYKKPQNINQITKVMEEARLKTKNVCV